MNEFLVTDRLDEVIETFTVFGTSVSGVKKYVTNEWNKHQVYGAKIINVAPVK